MKLKAENASKAIVHPQFQPEADGYMKLDDIKGEFSPSRESLGGSSYSPWDHEVINASDFAPATKDVGWWTVDGADFRDHNHGKRSNWDVICDVGTSIKQPADLRTNGAVHQDTPMDTHPNDYITTIGHQGYSEVEWTYLKDGVGKNDIPQDVHPNQIADALLQQPSDTAGLINPDSMRPVDFANNQVMFETGLPVEGIGESNTTGTLSLIHI